MAGGMSSAERTDVPSATPDTRAALLTAAIDILRREGAGAMTVRSVATAAGCSTTGVYTWFGGKGGLVEAIFIDGFEHFGAAVRAQIPDDPAEAPLLPMAIAYRRWALANPTQYMVMFGKAVPDYEPSDHARAIAMGTFDDLVAATRHTMTVMGRNDSPAEIAHHLWAGIHGYVSLELAGMDMTIDEVRREARFHDGLRRLMLGAVG